MSVVERVRTTLAEEAASVTPPPVEVALLRAGAHRVRRRRRVLAGSAAAAVVAVAAVAAGTLLTLGPDSRPSPAPTTRRSQVPVTPPPADAVWYDDAGLHHGRQVYPVPGPSAPLSLTLVRDGALYLQPSTLRVLYQRWDGSLRAVGRGSRSQGYLLGPGSDPRGTTAAWFDGRSLVVFDTARGAVLARQPEPGLKVGPYYGGQFGTRFRFVDATRVVWDARAVGMTQYDVATGTSRVLSRLRTDAPYDVDLFPGLRAAYANTPDHAVVLRRNDGRVVFRGGWGPEPALFSPDGHYLVTLDAPGGDDGAGLDPVVVGTGTGSAQHPAAVAQATSVGWGYGHLLMCLQGVDTMRPLASDRLLVYDAGTDSLAELHHSGPVILPAG